MDEDTCTAHEHENGNPGASDMQEENSHTIKEDSPQNNDNTEGSSQVGTRSPYRGSDSTHGPDNDIAATSNEEQATPIMDDENPPNVCNPQSLQLMCMICHKQDDNLKSFVSSTWDTFKRAAESRLMLKNDRYRETTTDVSLLGEMPNDWYHSACYKNYTAVRKPSTGVREKQPIKKPETRRRSSMPPSDERGLLKGSCIFCPVQRKTIKGKVEPLSDCSTDDGCRAIFEVAPRSSNDRLKSTISTLSHWKDLQAKEAQYHKSCRRAYFKEVDGTTSQLSFSNRQLHAKTFDTISTLIEAEVIQKKRAMLVTSTLELYRSEYLSLGGTSDDFKRYTAQAFMKKIKERFKDRISMSVYDQRRGNFLYDSTLSECEARARIHDDDERHLEVIQSAALYLRSVIQEMPKWNTPTPTSVQTLKASSPDLPEEILLFYKTLLCGLREPTGEGNREAVNRKVMSMSSDAVYNASRGSVRPWKHTVIGLGLGSLTGSKLILRILNRLGIALSYDEVKALETEFAYSNESNGKETPDGVRLNSSLGTGLAWDNYDVNMETIDGKDTLHATVGICYQNDDTTNNLNNAIQTVTSTIRGRKRRQFRGEERDIEPYYKQLKRARFDIHPQADHHDENDTKVRVIDFHWLLQNEIGKPLPLYPGFFSQFINDPLPQQTIWYMEPLPAAPTRNDVVRETMKRSMKVAVETQQEYGIVTYDLAVAIKAHSIQALDAPLFDNLLVMLGNFHLELAFYGAVGTFLNDSGAEYLLNESGILAEGSLVGFIRGKFYNRCVRIHDILALVMEMKLYASFWSTLPQDRKDAIEELLAEVPSDLKAQEEFLGAQPLFAEHMQQYEQYFQKVLNGELGPTAQYWAIYVYMINRVHRDLMRALRTNNVEEYISALPAIIDIFFALNRTNYARWGVLFLNQLERAPPQAKTVLKAGAFSIRRTGKNFSRSAIDLTLEQTVNRDAASPMRGIVGFHHSVNAIRRWCITSTQRGMAVTELRSMTGLEIDEQPASQLRPRRIEKDSTQRNTLLKVVTESCDPFSVPATSSACLLNVATGKAASAATQKYLLESLTEGHERHMKFREECTAVKDRFLKPIPKRKVANFAQENSRKHQTVRGKTSESLRDAFIRILVAVSQQTNFDLQHVLSFPLTKWPLAITHSDGSRMTTNKSKLLKKLEELQDGFTQEQLPLISVTLIDGGLLIHSFLSTLGRITTYGNLARSLLASVCSSQGNEIHVVFDTYRTDSLKESERMLRGAADQPYVISGPEQTARQSCQKLLLNGTFKDQLAQFLLREWQEDKYGAIIANKTLVVSHGGNCVRLTFDEDSRKMNVEHPPELQGEHEEADTLLAFHAASGLTGNIIVRASDTDVLVILLGMLGRNLVTPSPLDLRIIMDCGSGNDRRHIDISGIALALESKQKGLTAALPGLHSFTGCDYTTAFYRKGKVKPLEILEKDSEGGLINFFTKLASPEEPDLAKAEEFVCRLYGFKDTNDANQARHMKLRQMTGKINKEDPMANLKKVDCALLPPCSKTIKNKLQRAHYVSLIWGSADSANPANQRDPLEYGWKDKDGCYIPDWFSGPPYPDNLFTVVEDLPAENESGDQLEDTDVDAEFDELDDSGSEAAWSDDSDNDIDA